MKKCHACLPDMKVSVRQVFGIDSPMEVPFGLLAAGEYVPEFDSITCSTARPRSAILVGFAYNRRVMIEGATHGTGKSTHIEQVAARLNGGLRVSTSTAM